jgi:hypothetical protein
MVIYPVAMAKQLGPCGGQKLAETPSKLDKKYLPV